MNWLEIKNSIRNDLMTRGLSQPSRRLSALDNVEDILRRRFPEYLQNPSEAFGKTDKNQLKALIAQYKPNGSLNSAESSVINEIYYRI
jgi:hypothetical protein